MRGELEYSGCTYCFVERMGCQVAYSMIITIVIHPLTQIAVITRFACLLFFGGGIAGEKDQRVQQFTSRESI